MKALDLDTSMRHDTITWGSDCTTHMVPKGYWNEKRIAKSIQMLEKKKPAASEQPTEQPEKQPTMNQTAEAGYTKAECNANEMKDARYTTAKSNADSTKEARYTTAEFNKYDTKEARYTTAELNGNTTNEAGYTKAGFNDNATYTPVAQPMARALQNDTAEDNGEPIAKPMARALQNDTAEYDGEPIAQHMDRALQHATAKYEEESYMLEGAHFTKETGFEPGTKMKVIMNDAELYSTLNLGARFYNLTSNRLERYPMEEPKHIICATITNQKKREI